MYNGFAVTNDTGCRNIGAITAIAEGIQSAAIWGNHSRLPFREARRAVSLPSNWWLSEATLAYKMSSSWYHCFLDTWSVPLHDMVGAIRPRLSLLDYRVGTFD
jgi:hypothetical protein